MFCLNCSKGKPAEADLIHRPHLGYHLQPKSSLVRGGRGAEGQGYCPPLTRHHDDLVHVAPDPILSRLEGLHKRVIRGVEVLGRMFIFG